MRANWIITGLGLLILAAFILNAYRLDVQRQQIDQIVDAQSPLIFAFENMNQSGQTMTFIVNCELNEPKTRYVCRTEQLRREP